MSLIYGGKQPKNIKYGNAVVKKIIYGGKTVWKYGAIGVTLKKNVKVSINDITTDNTIKWFTVEGDKNGPYSAEFVNGWWGIKATMLRYKYVFSGGAVKVIGYDGYQSDPNNDETCETYTTSIKTDLPSINVYFYASKPE